MAGKRSTHFRKRLGLIRYVLLHPQEYGPEIRWFFWCVRVCFSLFLDRLRRRTSLLLSVPTYGHGQFLVPIIEELKRRGKRHSLYLALDQTADLPPGDLFGIRRWRVRPYRHYLALGKCFNALVAADIAEHHPTSPCPLRIFTDHGLPSKVVHLAMGRVMKYTHVFALGPSHMETWEDTFRCHPELRGKIQFLEVGFPHTDRLFSQKGNRDAFVEQCGLDPSRPTVLYAPSFNKEGSLGRFGHQVFDALAGMQDVNVLVKLHPVTYDKRVTEVHSNGVYWPDIVDRYQDKRFRHAGNVDVTECMLASDVLVTDISSIALEYYLLDRPVVYLASPEYFRAIGVEDNGGDNYFVNVGRPAGVEVDDMDALAAAIREAIRNPGAKAFARAALVKQLLYNPGCATRVAVDTLEKLLAERKNVHGRHGQRMIPPMSQASFRQDMRSGNCGGTKQDGMVPQMDGRLGQKHKKDAP